MERSPPEEAPESRASLSGFRIPGDWFSFSVFRIAGKFGFLPRKNSAEDEDGKECEEEGEKRDVSLAPSGRIITTSRRFV